ncbi:MAG: efflux RND transporter permease subunit, partial [Stenotrophomonas maltophilia]
MKLSDVSIQRPVFAVVMSLLLVVLGFMSFTRLTLRELPAIDPPIVSVSVDYTGASAAVIESRITQVLEDALAGIEGIDTINARSSNGRSQVSIEFTSNRDIEAAANDVRDAVSRVADRMPEEARPPEIAKVESDADPIIWLNMSSTSMDTLELSDYADRYIVDRFSSLDGVAQVRIGGRQRYAMRIWLDRDQLAARGLTVGDVETALRNENVELPAGRIESADRDFTLRVERNYVKPEDFAGIPLGKGADGYVVRMGDVAKIELASSERRAYYRSNGEPNIGLGIVKTSTANALDVAREARAEAERISSTLPEGTRIFVAFDNTTFIEAAVDRVYATLVEAMLLVLAVIWLFLGSFRAALIPAVTVPVCLIAAFIALYAFGFSINLLTLLALVLCIGLVVDDAIVVVENVQRRIDLGEPPLVASKRGTTQVAFAVIATTAVLVAVFLPVGFLEGNTGRLFRELAVALAAAVALSAFVSLTLTPMMASKLLKPHTGQAPKGLHGVINRNLDRLSAAYGRFLEAHVTRTWVYIVVMILSLLASALLLKVLPSELAPAEDRGSFQIMIDGPEGAGFDYTVGQVQQVEKIVSGFVGEEEPIVRANPRVPGGWGSSEEMHTGRISVFLQPWRQRDVSTPDVAAELQTHLNDLRGVRVRTQVGGGLVRSQGQPFQIVLGGPEYAEIAQWRDRMLLRMADNPGLVGADSDYKETRPQMRVNIDRQRAADLGVSVTAIGSALETMMGSRRVTTFVDNGEEYDVLVQAGREGRASPSDLAAIRVRASGGELVPLSNLVTLSEVAEAGSLNRFNRLRSITINAGLAPGYPLGEAIAWAQQVASEELPQHAQISWKGESREYQNAGSAVLLTFAMALLVVFLVLAAQFESFIHPLVIMLTVPLGVLGALLGLYVSGGTINLFSQIG